MNEQNPFENAVVIENNFQPTGRTVDSSRGIEWIKQGWQLFVKNPGVWIALTLIFGIIAILLSMIPYLGPLAMSLLGPVFMGGIMLGCKSLAEGGELRIDHLFAGFKQNTGNLIVVGGLSLVATILIQIIGYVVGGGAVVTGASMGNLSGAGMALGGMFFAALLVFVLSIPLFMAMWFAPALVVFRNVPPINALKASFSVCLKNIITVLVYVVITLVLSFIAVIPLGLGLLILVPVMMGSTYFAYVELFE